MALQELTSYQGNAGLAGGTGAGAAIGVGNFDRALDAVDRFTAYTMQVNRDMWVQSNVEMQKTATEAAKKLEIQYGDLIAEDRTEIDNAVKDLYDFYHNNPNAVRYIVDPNDPTKNNSKEYNDFLKKKERVDHLIVRGNLRAQQLQEIDKVRSTVTDPNKIKAYDELVRAERMKPISENLLIPPDIAPFNWSAYLAEKSKEGARTFEYIQRFPNDILTVTKNMFDPFAASAGVTNDLNSNTPVSEELKKSLALQFVAINGILKRHTGPDGNIDMKRLEADPDARPFMEQIRIFNEHVRNLNNTDMVEGGRKTGQKVRQFLGYNEDLPTIDVRNLTEQDLVRMGLTYKMGQNSQVKAQPTDNAIQMRGQDLTYKAQMAELAFRSQQAKEGKAEAKAAEQSIADEKILTYYNLMNTPATGAGTQMQAVDPTTRKPIENIGHEVGITPTLVQAFSIPTGKTSVKAKETDASGKFTLGNTNASFTETTETSSAKIPARIFVVPDKSGNPNKNKVRVKYDDNSIQEFSSSQVFTSLNRIFGDDEKTQASVSKVSMLRLKEWKLSQPDVIEIGKRLGNLQQTATPGTREAEPTTTTQTTAAPAGTRAKRARPY